MLTSFTKLIRRSLTTTLRFNFREEHENDNEIGLQRYKRRINTNLITAQEFEYYYRPKLSEIDQKSREIIEMMKDKNINKQSLVQNLQIYLDYTVNRRTPAGLLVILTAVWQYKGDEHWRNYWIKRISQFILRSYDMTVFKLDRRTFPIVMKALSMRIQESSQKIKIGLVKLKIVEVITYNIQVLKPHEFLTILNLLTEMANKSSQSQKIKFVKLAGLIQSKLHNFFLKFLRNETTEQQKNSLTLTALKSANSFYKAFTPQKNQYVQSFYKILQKIIFNDDKDNKIGGMLHKTRAFSFYVYFSHFGKNQKGQYYRDLLLKKILTKKSFKITQSRDQQFQWLSVLFCYNIVCFNFFKMMDTVQFRYHQNLNYLTKEDIKRPKLDSFFWQYYSQKPDKIHKDSILYHIIKNIYPQKFIQTAQITSNTIQPPGIDNQFKIRVFVALQTLGLKVKSQVKLCERYVDFLVDDNIIVQCDGLMHFNTRSMQYSQTTHFRNQHFLLSGYKLITIYIYQYSVNRYVDQLATLIKSKLDLISSHKAVFVL